jgi:hypothetical protein
VKQRLATIIGGNAANIRLHGKDKAALNETKTMVFLFLNKNREKQYIT